MLYIEVAIDLKDRSFIELSLNIIALQSNINFIVNFTGSKEQSHCYYFFLTGSLRTDLEYSSGNTFS